MQKKRKRYLVLGIAFALGLSGCKAPRKIQQQTETVAKEEELTIGVTLAAESIYLERVAKAMQETAAEKGVKLILNYADWDVKTQEEQMESYITQGVGAIIMAPINSKAMLTSLKAANKAGIPVINVNMKVDGISTEYVKTYVGASSLEEGEKAAELMLDLLGQEGGKVAIIEGSPGSDPQIYRTQAFADIMAHQPEIEIVGIGNGEWTRAKAELVTIDLLRNNPDIKGLYCHDSEMAMGAITALESMDLLKQVKVVGIAENEEYMQAVRDGKLAGIVTQPPEYEGSYSVYCALRQMNGETLSPWYKDPIEVLTIDNVDAYQANW